MYIYRVYLQGVTKFVKAPEATRCKQSVDNIILKICFFCSKCFQSGVFDNLLYTECLLGQKRTNKNFSFAFTIETLFL